MMLTIKIILSVMFLGITMLLSYIICDSLDICDENTLIGKILYGGGLITIISCILVTLFILVIYALIIT